MDKYHAWASRTYLTTVLTVQTTYGTLKKYLVWHTSHSNTFSFSREGSLVAFAVPLFKPPSATNRTSPIINTTGSNPLLSIPSPLEQRPSLGDLVPRSQLVPRHSDWFHFLTEGCSSSSPSVSPNGLLPLT